MPPVPVTAPRPGLARRIIRRARREIAGWRRTTVRGPAARVGTVRLRGQRLRLLLPDAAALVRLAGAGRLAGTVRALEIRLAHVPDWQLTGLRPPRLSRAVTGFQWRRRGGRLRVRLRWARPYECDRALDEAIRAVLRYRPWEQTSGPDLPVDPCLDGQRGLPLGSPPAPEPPPAHRPAATLAAPALTAPTSTAPALPVLITPVLTALANPYGRTLVGAATRYQLATGADRVALRDSRGRVIWHADRVTGPEAGLAGAGITKYAVASVDVSVPVPGFTAEVMRTLAACGMVFATPDPAVRAALAALGVVAVEDPDRVEDLTGYALSVQAARQAALCGDPALRRTVLAGGARPLPAVSAVVASKRAEHLDTLLDYLAAQTYPALEAVVGLHGYHLPPGTRERLPPSLPVRFVHFPAERTLGEVLGELSRRADGELLTKLDDDDHYGPDHVTDLFLAWHSVGADLVAKGARFVHFPERGETIDRAWAAPEVFDVTPAGGTLLLSRGGLAQVGGWSHAPRHVDADLLARVRDAGGLVYRTHALEYVYVRRSSGHTFVTDTETLLAHGERTYPGLPPEIVRPDRV